MTRPNVSLKVMFFTHNYFLTLTDVTEAEAVIKIALAFMYSVTGNSEHFAIKLEQLEKMPLLRDEDTCYALYPEEGYNKVYFTKKLVNAITVKDLIRYFEVRRGVDDNNNKVSISLNECRVLGHIEGDFLPEIVEGMAGAFSPFLLQEVRTTKHIPWFALG